MSKLADTELIARSLLGDYAAFGILIERHQSAVRLFLRHLNRGDAAAADDLAQETFIRAHRNQHRYHAESSFRAWLFGIAHNLFRNEWRRNRLRKQSSDRGFAEEHAEPKTRAVELRTDLSAAMAHLSADEQLAIHLYYHQDLTHPEIAKVTDWPLGTVKTHLARAKAKLRNQLRVWNPSI